MPDKQIASKKGFSADWLLRGALARIGDTFDKLTGRRWVPSSSLATSGLIERLKLLIDAEAREVPGKGTVVPHNIRLKMQWDKFSTDADDAITRLETELLTAAADHINDSLYYTYAPLRIEVKRDYFTEGVKLFVGFESFTDDESEAEINVTVPSIRVTEQSEVDDIIPPSTDKTFVARFAILEKAKEKLLVFPSEGRLPVGRSAAGGLGLDDISVSKIHASLAINVDNRLCVADTGSTNGTFINGERIPYGKAVEISEGDIVRFGLVDVEFERVPATADEETGGDEEVSNSSRPQDGGVMEAAPQDDAELPTPNDTIEIDGPVDRDVADTDIVPDAATETKKAEKPGGEEYE